MRPKLSNNFAYAYYITCPFIFPSFDRLNDIWQRAGRTLWSFPLCHFLHSPLSFFLRLRFKYTKKRKLLKNPTKIEEIQQKNFIDRNWTITTCLLRDSNQNYQCLKITSCRWRPPLRMHSFNLPLRFPIARCNISAGIPRISSSILCFSSSSVLDRVV